MLTISTARNSSVISYQHTAPGQLCHMEAGSSFSSSLHRVRSSQCSRCSSVISSRFTSQISIAIDENTRTQVTGVT